MVSRERSPQASRIQPFDVFQGAPPRDIDLPRPNTVDLEEWAFFTEVAPFALQDTQDEQQSRGLGEPSGAACAAASTKVSLSESEDATLATLATITEYLETPDWVGSAHVAALTNTLTDLTLAGVLATNTYVEEVVHSFRKVVTVTRASMGVEVEFTLRPRKLPSSRRGTEGGSCDLRGQFPL